MAPFSNEIIGTITSDLIGLVLGVDEIELDEIVLFPNPVNRTVTLSSSGTIQIITIYNVLGTEVLKLNDSIASSQPIDISELSSGIYLVKVENDANGVSVKRLVKR